jgi:YfiH family protein
MHKSNGLIQYQVFKPYKSLLAFTTTKQVLVGKAVRFTGDSEDIFQENRSQLAQILGIEIQQLVFPRQTHTNCAVSLSELPKKELTETDALITNRPNICLCVQTADCVPILLFDPKEKVIAAIHAGWRGTVKKITTETVEKMIKNYGSKPENIRALIGPSIGPEIYEVGDEVVKEAQKHIPNVEKTLYQNNSKKFHFNLWEANRQLLLECGFQTRNIQISEECSFTLGEKYFSARREGVQTGRMVSGIMLKDWI